MFGYAGQILRVDLSKAKTRQERLDEKLARMFLGGRGFASKFLFDELKPDTEPFEPENKLVYATGPLTGAPISGGSRYLIASKSPLTGMYGEALAGGHFAAEMKFSGYDMIIVEGRSESPVYLLIHKGEAEVRDAAHLWGKTTAETLVNIRNDLDDQSIQVSCIGPAGENLVRYSAVMSSLRGEMGDAAGRCGMGAVMGSKKLKAVAVRGTTKPRYADEKKLAELGKKVGEEAWKEQGESLNKDGTDGGLESLDLSGRLPTKNFSYGTFAGAKKITGETITSTMLIDKNHCYACRVGCKRIVKATGEYDVDPMYGGPEYETCAAFGSYCMNDNLVAIAKANELCNKYGLDTISTGNVIGFSMECYERGLLTKNDLDGIDLKWGNHKAIVQLVEKIAKREGVGNVLAEGTKRVSEKIGRGAEEFAMHVKGLELPMHEPRGKKGVGLSYATSIRGGCHCQTPHDDMWGEGKLYPEIGLDPSVGRHRLYVGPEKAKAVVIGQNWWSGVATLSFCLFIPAPFGTEIRTLLDTLAASTGWDLTPMELMQVGERAWNMCAAFNAREGMTSKDDTLPKRLMQPLSDGPYTGESMSEQTLKKMLDYYYECRGWNGKTGLPTREKLNQLGLENAANELVRMGKI